MNELYIILDISKGKEWWRGYYKSKSTYDKEFNKRKGYIDMNADHNQNRRLEGYFTDSNTPLKMINKHNSPKVNK